MRKVVAVAVLSFSLATGAGLALAAEGDLTYIGAAPGGALVEPVAAASSPDDANVYVVTGDSNVGELLAYERDEVSGGLTLIETETNDTDDPGDTGGTVDKLEDLVDVAVSGDGKHVYALADSGDALVHFERDGVTGELSFVAVDTYAQFNRPEQMVATNDGTGILIADRNEDSLFSLNIDPVDGSTSLADQETDGVAGVTGLDSPEGVDASGNGEFVAVAGRNDDAVVTFTRNPATGLLTFVEAETMDLNLPDKVLVSGVNVYATTLFGNKITAFERDVAGQLTFLGSESQGTDDPGDAGPEVDGMTIPTALATDSDRDHVYVAGSAGSTAVFDRVVTGVDDDSLIFVGYEQEGRNDPGDAGGIVDGLAGLSDLLVSDDDADLYAVGTNDGAIARFDRDDGTGDLSYGERMPGFAVGAVQATAASPNGEHVYSANGSGDSITVFSRNAGTGELTPVSSISEGGVATGIDNTYDVVVSPDGAHVYAAGYGSYGLGAFARNATTGALTFVESELDDEIDPDSGLEVEGLEEASSVTMSPDGKHLYATANGSYALTVFERDPATGRLSFVEAELDNEGDVPADALYGAYAAQVSADGKYVYVASADGNAVSVFSRNAGSGAVTFVEAEFDSVDDPGDGGPAVSGMSEPKDLVLSRDEEQLYVVSTGDSTVVTFDRDAKSGKLSYANRTDLTGSGPTGVAASTDGKQILVSADSADAVEHLDRDLSTGVLTQAGTVPEQPGLDGAQGITIVEDNSVYVAGEDDGQIGILAREPDTTDPKTKLKSKPKKKKKQGKKKKKEKFKFSSASDDVASFECRRDTGKKWKSCTSAYKKKYKAGDGKYKKHTFSVRAIDWAGNKDGSPAKFTFKRKLK